ncbi:MAG: hypothetical protein DRJ01_00385 [Bacteroidetes bacterium]|nr:MAG: hypothetical protein DRJ01_00385 [Bacteroidota bacterium]
MFGRKEKKTINILVKASWGLRKAYEADLIGFSVYKDFFDYAEDEIDELKKTIKSLTIKE